MDYMKMIMDKVGLGDNTYLPLALHQDPPNPCMAAARQEAECVMFGSLDNLFEKTKLVQPKDIGILIVNCSVFHPVPSLSSMIVHRYKLEHNILSYNLTGMGCTAGLLAIRLANQLLQVHENTCALILSTENTTDCIYVGNDESKFIPNCTFRVGGAAILLSNRPSHKKFSKYQLLHDVHTHGASLDRSYKSIFLEEDEQGDESMEASKITLQRFGNTSSSSVWYELAYAETKRRIKRNDRIWQMAFGSGFKCSSLIWRATRSVDSNDLTNPWNREMDTVDLNFDGTGPFYDYFELPKLS
ncbi:hypothetical protein HAX54_042585 [Datura stramonium]|uniref:FAE domain-containing protein n=1 Tax=Datura stramonium TaxID=4076 RepID=A0ABS8VZN6_DATST|nr:hypothetical protein [Datura stramonium]